MTGRYPQLFSTSLQVGKRQMKKRIDDTIGFILISEIEFVENGFLNSILPHANHSGPHFIRGKSRTKHLIQRFDFSARNIWKRSHK